MRARYFFTGKAALIFIAVVGFCLKPSTSSAQEDDTTRVLKIRKSYDQADFFPRIHGRFNGGITKAELMDSRGVYTKAPIEITSFEMHSQKDGSDLVLKATSNKLTPQMCRHIKRLYESATIYFRKIKGQSKEGKSLDLNDMRFVIQKE